METGRATLLATLACVVAAACWAANAIIAAGAFERGVTPERLAESRVVVALVPLAACLVVRRRDLLRPPREAVTPLIGFGACMVAVNYSYYVAIDRVPVGVAIALQYTAPVLILAATALIARRSPPATTWIAGALTLAGAALVSGGLAGGSSGPMDGIGLVAGIGAALSFAGYLVTAELAGRSGAHPATSLFVGFVVATVIWLVVLPAWTWPFELLADPDVVWRVLAVGLVGTLLPFALTVAALRWISSAVAGIATTTEPVLAAALAWAFLGQALTVPQFLGGAMVVAGVLLAQVARAPSPEATSVEIAPRRASGSRTDPNRPFEAAGASAPRIGRSARLLHRFRAGGGPMETDRTQDSVEQLEEAELPNPITDPDASLGEAGDALIPEGEAPETDKDDAEGPAPHTTQMPR